MARTCLRASDLEQVVRFLATANELNGSQPFTPELLDLLKEVVPCDLADFKQFDLVEKVEIAFVGCSDDDSPPVLEPQPMSDEQIVVNEGCSSIHHRMRVRDPLRVVLASDLDDRSRRLNHEPQPWTAEWGIVDGATVPLEPSFDRKVWVCLWRCGRDFDERDRQVLELLQPHLAARLAEFRQRRLHDQLLAALAAAPEDAGCGIVLLGEFGEIAFSSELADDLLDAYFGPVDGRLPSPINDWLQSGRAISFASRRNGHRLVVDAVTRRGPLLLVEHTDARLTRREHEVMRCVAAGMTNAQIAHALWVTPATVAKHLEHVYAKLGVHGRTAALAQLSGLYSSDRRESRKTG